MVTYLTLEFEISISNPWIKIKETSINEHVYKLHLGLLKPNYILLLIERNCLPSSQESFSLQEQMKIRHVSISFTDSIKCRSFITCLMCRPSKIFAFGFFMVSLANLWTSKSMLELSFFKVFSNCFIKTSCTCSGG